MTDREELELAPAAAGEWTERVYEVFDVDVGPVAQISCQALGREDLDDPDRDDEWYRQRPVRDRLARLFSRPEAAEKEIEMDKPDWAKADAETVKEIVRGGEAYLAGQVRFATSADQRAVVLAGVFIAAGTAIIGALVAAMTVDVAAAALVVGGAAWALCLMMGGALCISTALPVKFYMPGNHPRNWYRDVAADRPLVESLGEVAEYTQEEIEGNDRLSEANARRYRLGALIGLAAPLVGGAAWLIAILF